MRVDAHGEDARLGVLRSLIQHPAMRTTTVLRILLAIQHLGVQGFFFEERGLVVKVSPKERSICCSECGAKALRVKDRRERRWRHLDLGGMTVHLLYAIRRVHCEPCGTVKTEKVAWADAGSNFTRAFEERTAYLAQQSSSTAVSKLLRVTWRTVGRIIRRVVVRELKDRKDPLDGLKHIGVDELSYRRHHEYVTVVVDHERGVVVWASRGKNAATLSAFFEELGEERCAAIESVTIDMSKAFIKAVEEKVPSARLVFDRFHVQRLVQDALDATRRDEVRAAVTKEDKSALKNTRWALLKSDWNLTGVERETLEQLEHTNRSIFRGHILKESFGALLDRRQINVAGDMLARWIDDAKRSGLEHFERAARTIERCSQGILEYVRTRFSNGRTEGMNGKIRTITRRSFGFHSARALIAMIFLCCGGVTVTPAFSTPTGFH